ncbi:MAG TPA: ATP-binding cassette domain-containing protein [Conexibacter sp.]|nr:ATP-binding cassette domain-containing protein [Conexibacter sp.]
MTLLTLEHVDKTYYRGGRHRLPILRGATLHVDAGELAAVVADPTAGKTTLLRIAAGLEPPDAGTVRLAGEPLPARNDPDPRIALVTRTPPPRETMGMRMLDLVAIPLLEQMSLGEAHRRVTPMLEALGIGDLASATWVELSDAERAAIRVAQAAVRRPLLLLVDDVASGLGIAHVDAVLSCLRRAADDGTAVLMTAGSLEETAYVDALHSLSAGSLVAMTASARGQVLDFPAERR